MYGCCLCFHFVVSHVVSPGSSYRAEPYSPTCRSSGLLSSVPSVRAVSTVGPSKLPPAISILGERCCLWEPNSTFFDVFYHSIALSVFLCSALPPPLCVAREKEFCCCPFSTRAQTTADYLHWFCRLLSFAFLLSLWCQRFLCAVFLIFLLFFGASTSEWPESSAHLPSSSSDIPSHTSALGSPLFRIPLTWSLLSGCDSSSSSDTSYQTSKQCKESTVQLWCKLVYSVYSQR